ncbi:MAG: O-antigen ligase family protein [bacterium]|nr:O-antigen ligase family protein [bacterium]
MFSEKTHRYIFLFGVFGLAFGMMIGTVPTSVPQIVLMANWLLEGDFKRKWSHIKSNKIFWVLSSVFFISALGLLYTSNLQAGWDDVRTKMPLLLLPLFFFSSKPLNTKEYHILLYLFMAGCVVNTLWCMTYTHVLHKNEVVRDASRFMSHIRLGLYLNIALSCCVYFIVNTKSFAKRILMILLFVYFLFSLYALGLASGMVNFVILFFLFLCVIIYMQKPLIKFTSFLVLITFVFFVVNYVLRIKDTQLNLRPTANNVITKNTPWGTPYIHFDTLGQKENGNYVLINIQLEELQREWKRLFPDDSFSYSPMRNIARYEGLVRYLASKGLNKDSAAVVSLTEEDKQNIQNGIYNFRYPFWSFLHRRVYELVNEYDEYRKHRHVNGHSFTMRLYFWDAGFKLVKENPFFGVGTGDVQVELNKVYVATNSPLNEEWYKRPHNQFLTITVALGCCGLLVFLWSLLYPIMSLKNYLPKLFWPFFIIVVVSFMVEDTLETQAGLSFYAFFNTLFMSRGFFEKKGEG